MNNFINEKLNVAICGTGKIGTDLMLKTLKSEKLNCMMFTGRNAYSTGIQKAIEVGVPVSTMSIQAILEKIDKIDIVFDATSADHHRNHAKLLEAHDVKIIDLTPAKIGPLCVPSINSEVILENKNINMITCGGQSSIPIIELITKVFKGIESIELQSYVTPNSIGPATIANIDDYYATTRKAITTFSKVENVQVELNVDDTNERPEMLSVIRAKLPVCDLNLLQASLNKRLNTLKQYIPGYRLTSEPSYKAGVIEIRVGIQGQGDWLPTNAGNLDIINAAAIELAEQYANHKQADRYQQVV